MYSDIEQSLITAIVPVSTAMPIVRELHEKGIYTANKSAARGSSATSYRHDVEMEVLTVVVKKELVDEIFALIYERAEMYKQNHGIIFESLIHYASPYELKPS